MNSSRKSSKTVIVFVLAFALLISALMPMMVMGSSNDRDRSSDYQYYSVKSGDTLTRIAKNYGVTISDIMTANNLSSADRIVAGKVLKVPISSSSSSGSSSLVSTRLSINVVDADVRDILSAIALNAGYTIIFAEDVSSTLTVNLESMTALKAVDYVTRLAGVTYLKDGNTLMIGSATTLNSTFIDKTVLSRLNLKYITAELIMSKASELGLSSVQMMSTTMDQHTMYVSGYPKEMAKLQELLTILDVSTNIMAGSDKITDDFSSVDLTYIDANEFNGLLSSLGLAQGIVLGSRPYTLYVYVTGDALRDIKTIKNVVDKPLSGKNAEATTAAPTDGEKTTTPVVIPPTTAPSTTTPSGGGTPTPPADENKILSEQQILNNIDVTTATSILSTLGLNVTMYSNNKFTKTFWLLGTAADVQKAIDAINNIDTVTPSITESFTAFDLGMFTASEMIDRLSNVTGLENVTYKTTSSPETSHILIVYATADMMNTVKEVIEKFKTETLDGAIENGWIAIEAVSSVAVGQQRMDLLKDLYPDYLGALKYQVVTSVNKDDGTPRYITYVEATGEKADYIKALLANMDEA